MMKSMVRTADEKVKQVFANALNSYIKELYDYNFSKLLKAEANLQNSGRAEDIQALYQKTFGDH